MRNKKGLEMSFNVLFALIAGAVILFLSIVVGGRIIRTSEISGGTQTADALIGYLDSLETGLASGKSASWAFAKDTKIETKCYPGRGKPFGTQTITFSEKTFGKEYGEKGLPVDLKTKYLFVERVIESKDYLLFSKQFKLPYKIGDVIVLGSDNYCFVSPPKDIKQDINELNLENIRITDILENCTKDITSVCFDEVGCDIQVKDLCDSSLGNCENLYDIGKVVKEKEDEELYYIGNLLYGAIFSSSDIYECNVERISNKVVELSDIYLEKINLIESKGCSSRARTQIQILKGAASNINETRGLLGMHDIARSIDLINNGAGNCELY
jgi:hypothetical protein